MKSDYKEYSLVAQSNRFVRETANNLKANEIKMFDIFVSCIDTKKPVPVIRITKTELLKAMGDTGTNYTTTYETLKSLFNKTFVFVDDEKSTYMHYLEKILWFHNKDQINIGFSKDILPMLINLKKNFLQYSVSDLNQLKSRYSMLMYKYILSYVRQYKKTDFYIELEEIRKFLNLKDKYKDFRNFDTRVLKVIEKEINNSKVLPFLIRYEKITSNKKITSICFHVRPRTTNTETDFFDIQNKILHEELYNELTKGNTPLEDIRNRQADIILERE